MTQSKALRTFEVHVEQCGNSTWQGKLTADGETVEFRSELELLLGMDRLLSDSGQQPCSQIYHENQKEIKKEGIL